MNSVCVNPHSKLIAVDFDPFADGELLLTAPASESQTEIWLSVQMGDAANSAYNLAQTLRLTGELDRLALESALQQLVQRHEALRTTFTPNGEIICIVGNLQIEIPTIDLSALDLDRRDRQLEQIFQYDVNKPFDIVKGPLFSAKIIKLADREHLLLLNCHHIICDGWSLGILTEDLSKLYSAAHQGITPNLPAIEKFSDYAILEASAAQSPEAIDSEKYWLGQFADTIPVLDFPTDRPRPPFRTFDSACEYWDLSPELVSQLKQLGAKSGCSSVTTLLAGFEAWLYRLTGQSDLVVGLPSAGQPVSGQNRLVGHCVNLLPLRTKVDGQSSFTDYLKVRRSTILDAYEHQQCTFGRLMSKLSLPRDPSRIPLVPITFNLDRAVSTDKMTFTGLEVDYFSNPRDFGNFELFVNALESHGKIVLECRYNTNLFDPDTIRRRLGEYETLLQGIVTNPDQLIDRLPLLTDRERSQVLVEWNQTQTDYPQQCIHQLFEAQVASHPDNIAVGFQAEQITYQELNHRSNQLAHHLISLSVQPGELVAIAIDRSISTIIAILGILKAGAAYLPLDLTYPPERLAFILENAKTSVLLTKQALVAQLPTDRLKVICLDTDWNEIATSSSTNPPSRTQPDQLAYVMYTSGSTGQPKGVCVPHRGVVRLVKSTNYVDFSPTQVFLQLAPIAFDASTFEIWGSLLNGAKLVLFPGEKASLAELAHTIKTQQITTLWLTAGLFHLMVDERIDDLQPLRQLIAGGDVLSVPHVQKVLSTLKNCQLINGYGPTENTTFTCCHQILKSDTLLTSVPIGRPISNTQVYLLDPQLQPVPMGIPGELYIGGDGLALGYFNLPDLTAEKFIPNPFPGSEKLYKTGDLVRYRPDGTIEFLGRIDNQVKIRGFRIELGEIEATIGQDPSVREVCVIDREDRPGDKRLVAYIVTRSAQSIDRELRSFLHSKLPDYLIPAAFVMMDTLPLTANGKVDRQALPIPDYHRQAAEHTVVPPTTELEITLVKIWERILGVESIGIRDNFFELGGHSLIAVRLFAEIDQIWGRNLPLATLFQAQTIEELANVLHQKEWVAPWSSLVPIQPHGSKPPLFCIHPIGGNILEYYPLANYLGEDQPVYGLQSQGLDGKKPPLNRVEEMANHYIKEILTIQPDGPYLLLGYSFGGLIAFEIAQQLQAQGKQVAFVGLVDLTTPNLPKVRPSFPKSIQIHLNNLWYLPAKNRSKYIRDRIDNQFGNFDYREFLIKSLSTIAPPSPQLLQLIDTNFKAGKDYIPRIYPGDVSLFRCQVQTLDYSLYDDLGWGKLVAGKLKIHDIPSIHYEILKEPGVQIVAEKLKLCLVLGGVNKGTSRGRDGRWEMGDGREEIERRQW